MCFLGYAMNQKGHRLLDPETSEFILSRDVKCHETIFPFKDSVVVGSST